MGRGADEPIGVGTSFSCLGSDVQLEYESLTREVPRVWGATRQGGVRRIVGGHPRIRSHPAVVGTLAAGAQV